MTAMSVSGSCDPRFDALDLRFERLAATGLRQQVEGVDLVLGIPARFGLGFGLSPMIPLPGPGCIFWGGFDGSLVIIDMDARAT